MQLKNFRDIMKVLPDGRTRDAIRKFNLDTLRNGRPSSVKELAELLGVAVVIKSLPRGMAGRLAPDTFSRSGYVIEVNERDSVVRRRWTVLHELGHLFLHQSKSDPFAPLKLRERADHFYSFEEEKEEREADRFAELVLFGDGALRAARTICGNNTSLTAARFGVSNDVISIALRELRRGEL